MTAADYVLAGQERTYPLSASQAERDVVLIDSDVSLLREVLVRRAIDAAVIEMVADGCEKQLIAERVALLRRVFGSQGGESS